MITLYTIGCPKCKVLETKLNQKNIKFEIIDDIDKMKESGIESLPMLEIDGKLFDFKNALNYINSIGD